MGLHSDRWCSWTEGLSKPVWRVWVAAVVMALMSLQVAAQPIVWQPVALPTDADMQDVIVAGDQFVAFGAQGTVLATQDGLDWRDVSLPVDADLSAGAALGGLWLVSGFEAGIWSSQNQGQTWTQADLPDLAGDVFSPSDIAIQPNGVFIAVGRWGTGAPATCSTVVAVSANGLDWTIDEAVTLPYVSREITPYDDGLVVDAMFGGPPCAVTPIIPSAGLFYAVGDSDAGFVGSEIFASTPPVELGSGVVWNQGGLWIAGRELVALPSQYNHWLRRLEPGDSAADVPALPVSGPTLSLAVYQDGVIVSHPGFVSFVDASGAVQEQDLPISPTAFAMAVSGDVIVGVGENGQAVRGASPVASFAIDTLHPASMLLLALLLVCAGFWVIPRVRGI